jgi:hypothetical protein
LQSVMSLYYFLFSGRPIRSHTMCFWAKLKGLAKVLDDFFGKKIHQICLISRFSFYSPHLDNRS